MRPTFLAARPEVQFVVDVAPAFGARVIVLPELKMYKILSEVRQRCHRRRPIDYGWHYYPNDVRNILGLHWPSKTVIVSPIYTVWANVIHELAHCVAATEPPHLCEETEFLGWEWAFVQMMGEEMGLRDELEAEWIDAMDDYGLGGSETIGNVSDERRAEFLAEALDIARGRGLLRANTGQPVPIR